MLYSQVMRLNNIEKVLKRLTPQKVREGIDLIPKITFFSLVPIH
jgi:hypothetical protein